MIVAFDLDDTLYPEITYVQSGLRAVARHLRTSHGVDAEESLRVMLASLEAHGRGRTFDDVLAHWGLHSRPAVRRLVTVYRHHTPDIKLPEESRRVLDAVAAADHALYLVTDGHKVVQAAKITALGLAPWFHHCYLTSRYGHAHAKPSTRTFELMLQREGLPGNELVYVADDPSKDFVAARALGGRSIRILTGRHAGAVAGRGLDADVTVSRLAEVPDVLAKWSAG